MVQGMPNAVTATTKASSHEKGPAWCAFQRRAPRVTSIATTGNAATRAESQGAPSG